MRRASILLVVASVLVLLPGSGAASAAVTGRLVYSDIFGGSGLYTSAPDGTGRAHVVDAPVYRPKWSPDGSTIAFIDSQRKKADRIDGVDADGANRRVLVSRTRLPAAWNRIGTYAWSPDGTQLAVCTSDATYAHSRSYVVDLNDSGVTLAAKRACVEDWSSTGLLLVRRGSSLVSMQPDGSGAQEVIHGGNPADAEWSPDGSKIVFMCGKFTHADICVIGANGSGQVNLTSSAHTDWSPTWSPGGTWLAWSRSANRGSGYGNLWRMRADGSHKTQITDTKKIDEYEPDWTVPVT
jgi:Tol biopolymer transport system component